MCLFQTRRTTHFIDKSKISFRILLIYEEENISDHDDFLNSFQYKAMIFMVIIYKIKEEGTLQREECFFSSLRTGHFWKADHLRSSVIRMPYLGISSTNAERHFVLEHFKYYFLSVAALEHGCAFLLFPNR